MFDKILFTIPIYLRSEEQYYKERDCIEKKIIENYGKYSFGRKTEIWWPPWRFNDVIGYLTMSLYGMTFVVRRYLVLSKRINRNPISRRKAMITMDPVWDIEEPLPQDQTNESLRNCLKGLLYEAKKGFKKRGYFVDTEYYSNLINCLDIEKYLETYVNGK